MRKAPISFFSSIDRVSEASLRNLTSSDCFLFRVDCSCGRSPEEECPEQTPQLRHRAAAPDADAERLRRRLDDERRLDADGDVSDADDASASDADLRRANNWVRSSHGAKHAVDTEADRKSCHAWSA